MRSLALAGAGAGAPDPQLICTASGTRVAPVGPATEVSGTQSNAPTLSIHCVCVRVSAVVGAPWQQCVHYLIKPQYLLPPPFVCCPHRSCLQRSLREFSGLGKWGLMQIKQAISESMSLSVATAPPHRPCPAKQLHAYYILFRFQLQQHQQHRATAGHAQLSG